LLETRMKSGLIVPLAVLSPTSLVAAKPLALTVHTDQTTKTISVGIYGQFLERIFHSVHGGLWGDQKSWFCAGNYVVMKLWRDSFAPSLLAVDEPDNIKVVSSTATVEEHTVRFTMPPPSAGVVRVTP
jgi:alpha-L-arabinofuranosidase